MNEKFIVLLILNALFFNGISQSKRDSATILQQVLIETSRVQQFSTGIKTLYIDSNTIFQFQNKSLADLLSTEGPISIKTYGMGSLATTSFRGGSASQTAILWNGFNINSTQNGQLDLSLIPISSSSNIALQCGGVGALWGSGAIGGAIHISNSPHFNSGLIVEYGINGGSFQSVGQSISLKFGNNKISSSLLYTNTYAGNNFLYKTSSPEGTSTTQSQKNAQIRGISIQNNNHILISKKQKLSISFWSQQANRNIPATTLENNSNKNQTDQSIRLSADWQYVFKNITTNFRIASLNDQINYIDPSTQTNDTSKSNSIISEIETKWKIHPYHLLNIGINNSFNTAESNGYLEKPIRNSTTFFASHQYQNKNQKFSISSSIRQEFIDNHRTPFTYSLGTMYRIYSNLTLKANISKLYRIPSFNDLYWNPGGNRDLLPEEGFHKEVGLTFALSNDKTTINTEITYFDRDVTNWIVWLPSSSFWTPKNILSVWSRGLETNSKIALKAKKINLLFSVNTNYVLSTNQKASSINDQSVGKQLMYVPIYSGGAKFSINYKTVTLTYRHSYTGYRYTSTDHSSYLDPYDIGSIRFDINKTLKKYQINSFFTIDNLWNKSYYVISYRPMPMRNFQLGLVMNYKQKTK